MSVTVEARVNFERAGKSDVKRCEQVVRKALKDAGLDDGDVSGYPIKDVKTETVPNKRRSR